MPGINYFGLDSNFVAGFVSFDCQLFDVKSKGVQPLDSLADSPPLDTLKRFNAG